jgi:hypothetical protein
VRHIVAEQVTDYKTRELHAKPSTRRVALIGGTTSSDDCKVALRYLVRPSELVEGDAIVEFERAFAQHVGVRYAYSFYHGRVQRWRQVGSFGRAAFLAARRQRQSRPLWGEWL